MKKGIIAAVAVVSVGLLAFTGCSKKAKKSEKISKSVQKDINKNNDFLSE